MVFPWPFVLYSFRVTVSLAFTLSLLQVVNPVLQRVVSTFIIRNLYRVYLFVTRNIEVFGNDCSPLFLRKGIHPLPRIARFDHHTTGATMMSNSALFRRSAQLEQLLNPRGLALRLLLLWPWGATRLLSTNPMVAAGSDSPGTASLLYDCGRIDLTHPDDCG